MQPIKKMKYVLQPKGIQVKSGYIPTLRLRWKIIFRPKKIDKSYDRQIKIPFYCFQKIPAFSRHIWVGGGIYDDEWIDMLSFRVTNITVKSSCQGW